MTNGVEMFITSERLILLDTQPVMSLSILDEMVAHDRERRPGTGGGAPDLVSGAALHNIQSVQLCSWLLSVCHVVLGIGFYFVFQKGSQKIGSKPLLSFA